MTLLPLMSLLGGSSVTPLWVEGDECNHKRKKTEKRKYRLKIKVCGSRRLGSLKRRLAEEQESFSRAWRNGKEGEIDAAVSNGPGWRLVSSTTPWTERLVRWRLCSTGEDERHKQRGRE
ncbi:hypothetical protein LR48_Vigan01g097100 [Vigna angularis]|uniref:Uncharacterized protein n=1 Tax=Phaseolus angularis TaxID=3914 RepID=A0A0L9TLQ9_PHAAN|nr:hypothetical protein LR48_Vigan01g097100 [Vigna angularis]